MRLARLGGADSFRIVAATDFPMLPHDVHGPGFEIRLVGEKRLVLVRRHVPRLPEQGEGDAARARASIFWGQPRRAMNAQVEASDPRQFGGDEHVGAAWKPSHSSGEGEPQGAERRDHCPGVPAT